MPRPADTDRLPFHRLVFMRRRSGWWTPLLTGLLGVAILIGLSIPIIVALVVGTLLDPRLAWLLDEALADNLLSITSPIGLALGLGSIAVLLPAYLLASLIVNGEPLGAVTSVAGRMRWGWLWRCAAVAASVAVVSTALSFLLPADESVSGGPGGIVAPADNPQLWASLLIILLLVPVQATAEEYIFRGYLMQSIGRWLRHPAFAILLPVPLFVLGHGYDPVGQTSVAIFAVAAGWLTWRTGGLEAAIALHVVNNLLAFGLGLAGLSDVTATSPGWQSLVFSTILVGVTCAAIEVMRRRTPQAAESLSASRIV